jgi:hypothetical protein
VQTNVFQQRLAIGGKIVVSGATANVVDPLMLFPYTNVELNNYEDVYLGDFTLEEAGNIDLITLIAFTLNTNGNNSLSLDYLKFVPVIK